MPPIPELSRLLKKTNKMTSAPSEDSDQPELTLSLIRVFAVRMKKPWVLSYPPWKNHGILFCISVGTRHITNCLLSLAVVTLYATLGADAIVHSVNESEVSYVITSADLLPKFKVNLYYAIV